jgi:hypothetical protein
MISNEQYKEKPQKDKRFYDLPDFCGSLASEMIFNWVVTAVNTGVVSPISSMAMF